MLHTLDTKQLFLSLARDQKWLTNEQCALLSPDVVEISELTADLQARGWLSLEQINMLLAELVSKSTSQTAASPTDSVEVAGRIGASLLASSDQFPRNPAVAKPASEGFANIDPVEPLHVSVLASSGQTSAQQFSENHKSKSMLWIGLAIGGLLQLCAFLGWLYYFLR